MEFAFSFHQQKGRQKDLYSECSNTGYAVALFINSGISIDPCILVHCSTQDNFFKTKILQLECHFTWDLRKEDTEFADLINRLEDQITFDLGREVGVEHAYSSLGFVRYLSGSYNEALSNLQRSEELTRQYHGDNCDKLLVVTYGNFAWLHYHMEAYGECESYLNKLKEISEKYPPDSPSAPYPEVLGEKGWTLLKFSRKYYDRAKECFRKALELEPDEGEWNAGYAIALYRTETVHSSAADCPAIKQLRRAVHANPKNDVLKVLLGLRLILYKKYIEADSLVEQALERSPEHPHVIQYVGQYFRKKGSVEESISWLKRGLEKAPKSSFIHYQLALCYKRKKTDLLQAGSYYSKEAEIQQLRDIAEKFPASASVLGEKAWTLFKFSRKYYGRAQECFKKALELEPDDAHWNTGYAFVLHRTETCSSSLDDSPAVKQLQRAMDINPGNDELRVLLALRLAQFKEYDKAERLVEEALENSPTAPKVIRYVGKFFRDYGSLDRSLALLKRASESMSNSGFIHHQLALCYKRKKISLQREGIRDSPSAGSEVRRLRRQCIYHLEQATTLKTGFMFAMIELAVQYGEDKQFERAEELFEQTLQLAKEKNECLQRIYFHFGEFQQYQKRHLVLAISYYMECLKLDHETIDGVKSAKNLKKIADRRLSKRPEDGKAWATLGFIHKAKGEKCKAIECYEKAQQYTQSDEYLNGLAIRLRRPGDTGSDGLAIRAQTAWRYGFRRPGDTGSDGLAIRLRRPGDTGSDGLAIRAQTAWRYGSDGLAIRAQTAWRYGSDGLAIRAQTAWRYGSDGLAIRAQTAWRYGSDGLAIRVQTAWRYGLRRPGDTGSDGLAIRAQTAWRYGSDGLAIRAQTAWRYGLRRPGDTGSDGLAIRLRRPGDTGSDGLAIRLRRPGDTGSDGLAIRAQTAWRYGLRRPGDTAQTAWRYGLRRPGDTGSDGLAIRVQTAWRYGFRRPGDTGSDSLAIGESPNFVS
ncbi:hypothetical protein P4O66_001441 [Electrophorus voltai]|uniref:Uncharacterized protein n=1 Tax=Electrophorus voltai TaxID=2609070 RepID=A0AAD8Z774_9TELE|nr:hypothetical protein P4O66_001441 [Electrophorus voltai]